jgi:hypothetical protein
MPIQLTAETAVKYDLPYRHLGASITAATTSSRPCSDTFFPLSGLSLVAKPPRSVILFAFTYAQHALRPVPAYLRLFLE